MSTQKDLPNGVTTQPLSSVALGTRLLLIAIVVTGGAVAFFYAGGWLSPNELTPSRLADTLELVGGKHPGYRRNHAKGVGILGYFESNGNGERLSTATIFRPGRANLVGRFSLSGGNPYAADSEDAVRGFAMQLTTNDGEVWRSAMINLPVFPVSNPIAFRDRLLATRPDPKTGKPDPSLMDAFTKRYPETIDAGKIIAKRKISNRFANTTFNGLNCFYFINSSGLRMPVRWRLEPEQAFESADKALPTQDQNALFDGLSVDIRHMPLRWHLIVTIGTSEDQLNNATIPWDDLHERVDVGTLTINTIQDAEDSQAEKINFDPLVLPPGIEPSEDPLLSARSAVYSQSFTRRSGETREDHVEPAKPEAKGK